MVNNKGLKILIIILVLIILMLIGFIVWDKVLKEDNINTTTTTTITTQVVTYEISKADKEKAREFLKMFRNVNTCSDYLQWNYDERSFLNYNNMTEVEKGQLIFNYIFQQDEMHEQTNCGVKHNIEKSKYKETINKIFDKTVPDVTNSFETFFKVDYNGTSYELTDLDCGGCSDGYFTYDIIGFEQYNDVTEIITANYKVSFDKNGNRKIYDNNTNYIGTDDDLSQIYYNLMPYKYTFYKNGLDSSYFDLVELIKNN